MAMQIDEAQANGCVPHFADYGPSV
jgi:hypothetical protein